ncbi:MAG: hypothetical protein FIA94_11730 [Nitrospirae bacterium]|nr:hypothetical protein [Nitrospirota bacterium]
MGEVPADGKAAARKRLRQIIGGLYGVDMQKRFESAHALGLIAKDDPDTIEKTWNRLFYALDDTMSCWGVAEGLGEIARNLPGLRSRILTLLRKFQADESSCQGFIWAVCRIGQVDRKLVNDFIPDLARAMDSGASCMIGQSLWAIGELRVVERLPPVSRFLNDARETWIYENDAVRRRTLGDLAAEALQKLESARQEEGDR